MRFAKHPTRFVAVITAVLSSASFLLAQGLSGPQSDPPPAVAPAPHLGAPPASFGEKIVIPAGTRLAVALENGISTGNAHAGDSVYFHTTFPVTQNNRIVIPVGSYVRGELLEAKRPGRIKGRGQFRMRITTLIFPNGYTVDFLAAPRSADSGGRETTDSEGKVTGGGGKGKDVGTVATTTVTGTGIGAIAGGAKGAGIGAGIGALAGLGAVLLTRGPEAQLPRGSALDIVLEREIFLDSSAVQFTDAGRAYQITPPPARTE
ncbi:MAG: hypothetical protein NVS9B4_07830 [Candidatus Acidiferrum sp.]